MTPFVDVATMTLLGQPTWTQTVEVGAGFEPVRAWVEIAAGFPLARGDLDLGVDVRFWRLAVGPWGGFGYNQWLVGGRVMVRIWQDPWERTSLGLAVVAGARGNPGDDGVSGLVIGGLRFEARMYGYPDP